MIQCEGLSKAPVLVDFAFSFVQRRFGQGGASRYPPRTNRTIQVFNRQQSVPKWTKDIQHPTFPMRWKNIEYKFEPQLMRKPYGRKGRWGGAITRIEHHSKDHSSPTLV